ncbi:MAG TPA: phosphatase PAP2 family protein [Candidatus Angelobacter sp.]|nr:phosphatase PAP2 family protein [Candidatus Angelobacter sp.]
MHRPAPLLLVLVTAGVVVVALALLVMSGASHAFDEAVIGVLRHPELVDPLAFLWPVTELGSTWAVTLLAGVAIALGVLIGPWRHGIIAAAVIAGASLLNGTLKRVIARERPELLAPMLTESGYSFPSGHSALGMVGWGVLAVLVSRTRLPRVARIGIVAVFGLIVFLVGVSRVYLGVHYPTDVIAGWLLGAVIVVLFAQVTREVSREPSAAAVDADPAAPRSDRPGAG